MKFTQTNNQIVITQRPYTAYILSAVCAIVGVGLIVLGQRNATVANTKQVFDIVGGIFAVIGLVISVLATSVRTTITPGGDTIMASSRIGHKAQKTISTNSIKGVRLVSSLANGQRQSTILAVLNDGSSQIILEGGSGTNISLFGIPLNLLFSKPPLEDKAQKLADFLHVPIVQNDLASASGISHTVKEVMTEVNGTAEPDQLGGLVTPQMRAQFEELKKKKAEKSNQA